MIYKTQGIIVKRTDLGETDRLLTIYTKDFGKLLVRAKAIKKSQAKLKGHLELFIHSYLMLAQGKNFDIITNAETIESFPELHKYIDSLAVSYYLADCLDKLMAGPERDPRIWNLVLESLQQLDKIDAQQDAGQPHKQDAGQPRRESLEPIVKNFETNLLEFLGYGQQKDFLSFVQSLLNQKIHSKNLLNMVK